MICINIISRPASLRISPLQCVFSDIFIRFYNTTALDWSIPWCDGYFTDCETPPWIHHAIVVNSQGTLFAPSSSCWSSSLSRPEIQSNPISVEGTANSNYMSLSLLMDSWLKVEGRRWRWTNNMHLIKISTRIRYTTTNLINDQRSAEYLVCVDVAQHQ